MSLTNCLEFSKDNRSEINEIRILSKLCKSVNRLVSVKIAINGRHETFDTEINPKNFQQVFEHIIVPLIELGLTKQVHVGHNDFDSNPSNIYHDLPGETSEFIFSKMKAA